MDGEIHYVIAGYMILADIPIEGDRQIGNRPEHFTGSDRAGEKCTQDGFRRQGVNVKASIFKDVGFIV